MSQTAGLVQQFVERTGQLYSLPTVAAEVLRLTSEPRTDARALKDCLERDPALVTRLLRVVNSSLFGLSRPVADLNQALALLGIRPLKMLVLGFSLPKELFSGVEGRVLARYWRRTLVKAVAARELAEKFWQIAGDEAFIAGLVQDIGMLALIQQLGGSYQNLLEATKSAELLGREMDILGFDHLLLSSRLLGYWGLPTTICAAIAVPPDEAQIAELEPIERALPQILHLAELIVRLIEQPYGSALGDLLASGSRYCGLTFDRLQALLGVLQPRVEELRQVLALELPEGQSYVDLLIAAQRQLADEAAVGAIAIAASAPDEELLALSRQLRGELAKASGRARPSRSADTDHGNAHVASNVSAGASRAVNHDRAAVTTIAPGDIHPGLAARASACIQRCRQLRHPVTLALFEIQRFSDMQSQLGPAGCADLMHWLRVALVDWTGHRGPAMVVSDSCLALICEDCPRSEGLRMARKALAEIKPWSNGRLSGQAELTLSAGLATIEVPPKNYRAEKLIEAAQRCLHGAQLSGGDTVKSIEC